MTGWHLGLAITALLPLVSFRFGVPCPLAAAVTAVTILGQLWWHIRTAIAPPPETAESLAQRFHALFERATEAPDHPVIPWEGASKKHRAIMLSVCEQIIGDRART